MTHGLTTRPLFSSKRFAGQRIPPVPRCFGVFRMFRVLLLHLSWGVDPPKKHPHPLAVILPSGPWKTTSSLAEPSEGALKNHLPSKVPQLVATEGSNLLK